MLKVVASANRKSESQDQELASEGEKFSSGKLQRKTQVQQNQKLHQQSSYRNFSEIPKSKDFAEQISKGSTGFIDFVKSTVENIRVQRNTMKPINFAKTDVLEPNNIEKSFDTLGGQNFGTSKSKFLFELLKSDSIKISGRRFQELILYFIFRLI